MPSAYIDPSVLGASSPSSTDSAPSPSPQPAPSRKRPRSDMTSEERKEARAHRNRIAAQNSRDRRKLQFSSLSARVAELEEENKHLKDQLSKYRSKQHTPTQIVPTFTDTSRERENEELRERVRSLEKSWDTVMRMLAAQGKHAPLSLPSPPVSSSESDASPLFPLASPTLSLLSADAMHDELTRHSAAGDSESPSRATSVNPQLPSPLIFAANNTALPIIKTAPANTNSGIEDWFMDLIASPTDLAPPPAQAANTPAPPTTAATLTSPHTFGWEFGTNEEDVQKLLALLPQPEAAREQLLGLGLDFGTSIVSSEAWVQAGSDLTVSVV